MTSPNSKITLLLAGLLLAQVLTSGAASAQSLTQGPDLRVVDVEVGPNRVAEVDAPLTITIQNVGNAPFASATGWTLFIGFNGFTDSHCIEPGTSGVNSASDCYQRFPPGSTMNSIGPGERRTVTFNWNASRQQATTGQNATALTLEILSLQASAGGSRSGSGCNGPDAPNCMDNQVTWPVAVKLAGVRARPALTPPPLQTGMHVNTPWSFEEITDACPVAPDPIEKGGCKAVPGELYVASYFIKNVGNSADTFYARLVDQDNLEATRHYRFTLPPPIALQAGQEGEARVTLFIPHNDTAMNKTNVNGTPRTEIRWHSTLNPAVHTDLQNNPGCQDNDNELIDKGLCQDARFPSIVTGYRYGLNVTTNVTYRPASASRVTVYNLTLNNTGNAEDEFWIEFDRHNNWGINDSWLPNFTLPGKLKPGQRAEAAVTLVPPLNATNGTYRFDVLLRSRSDINNRARCITADSENNIVEHLGTCRLTLVANLEQRFDIAGRAGVPQRVVPGEPATFHLGVSNAGNGIDNVTLDLQTTIGGWDMRLSDRVLQVPPFGFVPFTLVVTPPPNSNEGTEGWFYINATSEGPRDLGFDQRKKADPIISRVTVLRGPNIQLATPINTSYVDPGTRVSYDVVVTNTGNVADNFSITPERQHPDWTVEAVPKNVVLAPTQQATVRIDVRAPAAAEVGEKTNVFVNVRSGVDPSRTRQSVIEARVSGPDLAVANLGVNATSPYTGDPVDVTLSIRNDGNKAPDKPVKLRLYFVQGGIERVIAERTYQPSQLPGQRSLGDRFSWDTNGIEGPGTLVARIDVDDAVREIDESDESNQAQRPLTLRTFDIRVVPAQGLSARPGEVVHYSEAPHVFVVEYRGNQPNEPVTIRLTSELGWLVSCGAEVQGGRPPSSFPAAHAERLSQLFQAIYSRTDCQLVQSKELSLSLPRGTPFPVNTEVIVPPLPGAPKDRLTLQVVPSLRPDSAIAASTETLVLDEERPRILAISATPSTVKLGERIRIEATVEDATGLSSVRAVVILPSNETTFVPMTREGDKWVLDQPWQIAGRYRVGVEAIDGASPPNENRTRDLFGTFQVTPGTQPVIKLADGQPTTIKTGTRVKLNITDPLGIGRATYSIKGISYDLRAPNWEIDTGTFAPGPVEVTVTAENIYGVRTTTRIDLTVDNRLPEVRTVRMTPENPKANEQVTLQITTEAKVEAVEVLVKRDGQVVATHPATRKSPGVFEVSFNAGEGDYALDVSAKDGAGNVRLSESAVRFSAKPGSPFEVPAPGLALVAPVLAALALALRRRRDA